MSKKNALGKLYDRLTPSERFRLDVEAHARGDEAESRRLVDSCPIRNYNMTDWAFSGRWQTTTEIVLAVCVELSQYMSRLNMIDAIRETLPYVHIVYHNEMDSAYLSGHEAGSRYACKRAGMEGDPPGWAPLGEDGESTDAEDFEATDERLEEADIMLELLTRLEEKTTQEAWTLFEAFSSFCREELEVEPEKVPKPSSSQSWPGSRTSRPAGRSLTPKRMREWPRSTRRLSPRRGGATSRKRSGSPGSFRLTSFNVRRLEINPMQG